MAILDIVLNLSTKVLEDSAEHGDSVIRLYCGEPLLLWFWCMKSLFVMVRGSRQERKRKGPSQNLLLGPAGADDMPCCFSVPVLPLGWGLKLQRNTKSNMRECDLVLGTFKSHLMYEHGVCYGPSMHTSPKTRHQSGSDRASRSSQPRPSRILHHYTLECWNLPVELWDPQMSTRPRHHPETPKRQSALQFAAYATTVQQCREFQHTCTQPGSIPTPAWCLSVQDRAHPTPVAWFQMHWGEPNYI